MPACTSRVKVNIAFQPLEDGPSNSSSSSSGGHEVLVSASASATGQTGVEMEALVAATFAAINLTLASLASGNNIRGAAAGASPTEAGAGAALGGGVMEVLLESKTGGKSGDYVHLGPTCGPEDLSSAASAGNSGILAGPLGGFAGGAPASASASLRMPLATWRQLTENVNKKGDVLGVSRLAGIMAGDMARELLPAGGRGGRRSDGFEVCSGASDAPCLVT